MSLDQTGNESKHAKENKKLNILNNAILVQQLINNFDPKNINDSFDDKSMPISLQKFEKENKNTMETSPS